MTEDDVLAARFEAHRDRLTAVASRLLGSRAEAEDAVQEAWLRVSRAGTAEVADLGAWLTTVVARVALNQLRARANRREDPLDDAPPARLHAVADPAEEAVLADSVGLALLVVLDQLAPAERLAFVLHDLFAVPFDEIAPIVDRSPAATRQLASRARRRVQGAGTTPGVPVADLPRQREVVEAFLAAARGGDFAGLLAVLDPDVMFRADPEAVRLGGSAIVRGARAVAQNFSGRARDARPALVDGVVGAVWAPGGMPRVALSFTIANGKIVAIDAVAEPARLGQLELVMLAD